MAYDKAKIFEQSKQLIVNNKLIFIDDIVALLPCATSTFYDFFPANSEEMEQLKGLLETQRTTLKISMRTKWFNSEAPALQMGLMKLISSPEELRKLSMTHNVVEETEKPIFKELDLNVRTDNSTD